jgi:hypothetical protein
MKKKIFLSILVVLAAVFVFGCAASLKDFKPSNPDEASIKEFFIKMNEMSKKNDLEGLAGVCHPNAKIMFGREKKILSREEYLKAMKETTERIFTRLSGLKIKKIEGNKAEVNLTMDVSGTNKVRLYMKYILVRHPNGGWLIMERTFDF